MNLYLWYTCIWHKCKVKFVVDDDFDITGVFSELLELRGLHVLGAGHNGIDAIELFKKYSPNIVFMDVHMPKLDGIEALKQIKKLSPHSQVIMITGDMSSQIEKQLKNIGATSIVYKPFDIKKIIQIIKEIKKSTALITLS